MKRLLCHGTLRSMLPRTWGNTDPCDPPQFQLVGITPVTPLSWLPSTEEGKLGGAGWFLQRLPHDAGLGMSQISFHGIGAAKG